MEIINNSKLEEYEKFKAMCPEAREIIQPDGSMSLVVEQEGKIYFKLDYIKQGVLSERDLLRVANWGANLNTAEDILEAYNALCAKPMNRNSNMDQGVHYYRVESKDISYLKSFIGELKRMNPDVEINGKWVRRNYQEEQLTLITSVPMEKLNQPRGYYGNALGRIIFPETEAEFSQSMSGKNLNYTVSENMFQQFVKALQDSNPEVMITAHYAADKGVGRIAATVSYDKLKYPEGYYGGFALDRDGFVGYLQDRVMDYKLEDTEEGKKYVESTQRYYDSVIYQKREENEETIVNQEEKGELRFYSEKEAKVELNHIDKNPARKFTILRHERAMNDAQKAKSRAELLAGICILTAATSFYFQDQDIQHLVQQQLSSMTSWEAFSQNITPLTALLSVATGGFVAKYFKNSKKLRQLQNQFIDFNASLENEQIVGGYEDAKSR